MSHEELLFLECSMILQCAADSEMSILDKG